MKTKKLKKIQEDSGSESEDDFLDPKEHKKIIMKTKKVKKIQEDSGSESEDDFLDPKEHKKSLLKLKSTDPEFYKFLEENDDEVLDFVVSSDEEKEDNRHIPNADLEIASDDSDYEFDDGTGKSEKTSKTKITPSVLQKWEQDILTDKTSATIKCVVTAFNAALQTVEDDKSECVYQVKDGKAFNGVIQICVMQLPDAFRRYLKLSSTRMDAHKAKRFPKIKTLLKAYLTDLIKILQNISSEDILTLLLKHLHQMLPFLNSFTSLHKSFLKCLLKFWSAGEDNVRVVAFLCIVRLAQANKNSLLGSLLKTMYIKYVENSKFASPKTLPGINFMRRSLVEIYRLDENVSYGYAFVYIRQMAIQLRNALTLKKKENFQTVYNWQFVNSLKFWAELLAQANKKFMLQGLIYPLVQITNGTIKLIPTQQYFPLRFHCVKILMDLSKDAGILIPTLPFILEILSLFNFQKKHKAVSMKPISLECLLRLSKSQMAENGFKDSVFENVHLLLFENASNDSHKVYFPDLYIPCILQLKAFLKKCSCPTYSKKLKTLLEKIEENRKFIELERSRLTLNLKNVDEIRNWETEIRVRGTPLSKFFTVWYRVYEENKLKSLTQNHKDMKLPSLKRKVRDVTHDSDLDMPVEEVEKMVKEQERRKKKKMKKVETEDMDDVNENLDQNDANEDLVVPLDDWN